MKKLTQTSLLLAITQVLSVSQALANEETTRLDSLVVTANNMVQPEHSVTSNIQVITHAEIEQKQYKTLDQALRQVPGISIVRNGGVGKVTSIQMRGQSSQNILILQDGIELNDPTGLSGANIENILLDDVERIEIVKGAQSGIWGSNASAGVIQIISKKAGKKAIVSAETGSNRYKKLATTLGAANEQIDFTFNFATVDTEGFTAIKPDNQSEDGFERDGFNQTDVSFNLGINLAEGQRLVGFIKSSSASNEFDSTFPSPSPDDGISTNDFSQIMRQLQYLGDYGSVNTRIFIQDNKIERNIPTFFANYQGRQTQYGASANWQYIKDQNLVIAANSRQVEDLNNNTSYYNNSVAITNTNQLWDQSLIFTQALRYDKHNKFDNKTTGKLGIKKYFSDTIFVGANYGTAYNAPTLFQLTYNQTDGLKPETITAYDVSFGVMGLEVSYFYSEIEDLINYNFGSGFPTDFYENIDGKSKAEGFEASYQLEITRISTDLQFNYSQQTVKDADGKWLAQRPEKQGGFSATYFGLTDTTIGIQTQYIGQLFDKADQQGAQIGEYFVTNLTADYDLNAHLNVYGRVENLFNEDYTHAVAGYQTDGKTPTHVYANGGTQIFVGIRGKI